MKITYDKRADALNITLKGGKVAKTLEIAPEIFVDFDKKNTPLYIEIIGAKEKLGKRSFSGVVIGNKAVRPLTV